MEVGFLILTVVLVALLSTFLYVQKETAIYWLRIAARAKKRILKKFNWPTSAHSWHKSKNPSRLSELSFHGCNACSGCLATLHSKSPGTKETSTEQIRACSVCGASANTCCARSATNDCKCVDQAGNRVPVMHHWSERWEPLDGTDLTASFCCHCDEPCGMTFIGTLSSLRCLRCKRSLHIKCFKKLASEVRNHCDLGSCRRIVLSPLSVQDVVERGDTNPENKKYEIVNLSSDDGPLLVFINAKSGAQNGNILRMKLNVLLNPIQVFELSASQGPEVGLQMFRNIKYFKILVCGGDGTATWVLQAIEKLNLDWSPPVAILPLGTGNDLSRVLNWGGDLNSALRKGGISKFLDDIDRAKIVTLDRWNVEIKENIHGPIGKSKKLKFMTNYLSVGCDARVAYKFHCAREEKPHLFYNQFMNKLIYTKEGAKGMIDKSCSFLPWSISLQVDGEIVEIPKNTQGILVLNIASYMGGVDLWQNKHIGRDENFNLQSMSDKTLEIACITNTFHLGKIQIGVSKAKRLAQGSSIRINLNHSYPVQIDGEPWIQPHGSLKVTHRGHVKMLKRTSC